MSMALMEERMSAMLRSVVSCPPCCDAVDGDGAADLAEDRATPTLPHKAAGSVKQCLASGAQALPLARGF
jgi:hypothetical protein